MEINKDEELKLAREYCINNNIKESHRDDVCVAYQAGRYSAMYEMQEDVELVVHPVKKSRGEKCLGKVERLSLYISPKPLMGRHTQVVQVIGMTGCYQQTICIQLHLAHKHLQVNYFKICRK